MRKTIIVISDFVEGEPVVASVRYEGLMIHFKNRYNLIVINDGKYGAASSRFSDINMKYKAPESAFTQSLEGGNEVTHRGYFGRAAEKLLRHKWILSAWRNYKYSQFKFDRINKSLFTQLDNLLTEHDVQMVFVTIPDVYGLYILDYLKRRRPDLPAVIEIRDIINHNIGEGNPRMTYKRAEQKIPKLANGLVAVSQGIEQHYQHISRHLDIQLIKNGYDEQHLAECQYQPVVSTPQSLRMVHIGSIYKGRNIKTLIEGLLLFNQHTGIPIQFDLVGLLDQQAFKDIHSVELSGTGVSVHILGSMEHEKAVERLKEADIAVILTHTKGSDYAIPGKTFEYIGACKPILAITEDLELVSLVHGRYGECCKHGAEEIVKGLKQLIVHEYDYSDRMKYSRTFQAEEILNFIDKISNTKMSR